MSKPRPGGGECARGCGATMASGWYGKKPDKYCRSCFGKETQRVKGGVQHFEPQT